MERMQQYDPEMFKLMQADSEMTREAMQMAGQFHRAPKEQRDKIKDQIGKLLAKHFDVRQKRREMEIKRMEERLKKLRESIAKRNESRDLIVGKRLGELIGEKDDLDF